MNDRQLVPFCGGFMNWLGSLFLFKMRALPWGSFEIPHTAQGKKWQPFNNMETLELKITTEAEGVGLQKTRGTPAEVLGSANIHALAARIHITFQQLPSRRVDKESERSTAETGA